MSRALVLVLLLALPAWASRDFERNDTDDRVEYRSGSLCTTYPFTWAIWFKAESGPTSAATLMASGDEGGSEHGFQLYVATIAGTNYLYMQARDGGGQTPTPTSAWTIGVWQHACLIATSATARRIVCNGDWANSVTSPASRTPTSLDNLVIGDERTSILQDLDFDGLLALATGWNVALTQSQVESLAGWNGTGADPSRALYPLLMRPDQIAMFLPLDGSNLSSTVGGYLFSNTGTVAADSPPIRRPQPQYSHAPALRSLWRRSPLYRDEEEDYGARAA